MTDNEWADIAMDTASEEMLLPRQMAERLERACERLARLRSRAYAVGAVRYDKDRVQTSNIPDLSQQVDGIMDAEYAVWVASLLYIGAVAGLRRDCLAAGFSQEQTAVWLAYYGSTDRSLQDVATLLHMTKSRVQYLMGVRAKRDFVMAVDRIKQDADYGEYI